MKPARAGFFLLHPADVRLANPVAGIYDSLRLMIPGEFLGAGLVCSVLQFARSLREWGGRGVRTYTKLGASFPHSLADTRNRTLYAGSKPLLQGCPLGVGNVSESHPASVRSCPDYRARNVEHLLCAWKNKS